MSNTPKLPDECKKLLDNGWVIVLHQNPFRSYTATAVHKPIGDAVLDVLADHDQDQECDEPLRCKDGYCVTDDFEPSQALYRLTEKVFGRIV